MVPRFARLGGVGVVLATVVLAVQWSAATRAGEGAGAAAAAVADAAEAAAAVHAADVAADVTVHEWGTFTTVAGEDGRAVEWLPLGGPVDLPCFVYSFNRLGKINIPFNGAVPDYTTARRTLKGTVRMETPVLYFYATRPAIVDVSVQFSRGMFSEWYPRAVVNLPPNYMHLSQPGLTEAASNAFMSWKSVRILPNKPDVFPEDGRSSHYYAARATDASPIDVNGEREKFLFYRGVAGFDSPIDATIADNGMVTITNRSGAEVPHAMLFTRRGARFGYRVHANLGANEQVTLDRPDADLTLDDVTQEIERTLVAQGLYVKEAQAMIETWRDSWFEDGTRLFYIVPTSTVDAVLPLAITPMPKSTVRVFVGRAELIGASDITIVAKALKTRDHEVLARYGRLLGPIADRVIAKTSSPAARADMATQLDEMLKAHAGRLAACGASPTTTSNWTPLLPSLAALR